MRTYGKTDIGRTRQSNQDAFVCGHFGSVTFAIVCDGMGGAKGGNVASALATKAIVESLGEARCDTMKTTEDFRHALRIAFTKANQELYDASFSNAALRGMGTTAVVVMTLGEKAVVAHVGDSRAYLLTIDSMTQITRDHSIVQEMIESGKITEKEAQNHPRKNFITRALGVEETVDCEFDEVDLPEGTALLLCTDGLTNMVSEKNIQSIIRSYPPDSAAERLISAANMAGGSDNITAVLVINKD